QRRGVSPRHVRAAARLPARESEPDRACSAGLRLARVDCAPEAGGPMTPAEYRRVRELLPALRELVARLVAAGRGDDQLVRDLARETDELGRKLGEDAS